MAFKILDDVSPQQSLVQRPIGAAAGLATNVATGTAGAYTGIANLLKSSVTPNMSGSADIALANELITPEEYKKAQAQIKASSPQQQEAVRSKINEATRLPTGQELQQGIENQFPSLKAGSNMEKYGQEFAHELGGLLSYLPGIGSIGLKTGAKLAGAATAGGFLADSIGLGEYREPIKFTTMIGTSLYGAERVKGAAQKIYDVVKEEAPNTYLSNKPLKSEYESLKKYVNKGYSNAAKEQINRDVVTKLKNIVDTQGDLIPFEQYWDLKTSLKDVMRDVSGNEEAFQKLTVHSKNLNEVLKNPDVPDQLSKMIKEADELWSGAHEAGRIKKTIDETINKIPGSAKTILSLLGFYHNPVGAASAFAGVLVGREALNKIEIALKNPSVRKVYGQAVRHASQENKTALIKDLTKLADIAIKKGIKEAQPTGRYKILD